MFYPDELWDQSELTFNVLSLNIILCSFLWIVLSHLLGPAASLVNDDDGDDDDDDDDNDDDDDDDNDDDDDGRNIYLRKEYL